MILLEGDEEFARDQVEIFLESSPNSLIAKEMQFYLLERMIEGMPVAEVDDDLIDKWKNIALDVIRQKPNDLKLISRFLQRFEDEQTVGERLFVVTEYLDQWKVVEDPNEWLIWKALCQLLESDAQSLIDSVLNSDRLFVYEQNYCSNDSSNNAQLKEWKERALSFMRSRLRSVS